MLTLAKIQQFPKAELHCHLDGSIRPQTLQKIARLDHLPIDEDQQVVAQKMTAPSNCHNLMDYLTCFDYVLPYLQTAQALKIAAFDVLEQAAADGIQYLELRFAPSLSQQQGLSVTEVIQAVAAGVAKAEAQYPIIGNLLICGMRQDELAHIQAVFQETLDQGHQKVVGLDLAGPERPDFPLTLNESVTPFLGRQGVQLTLHAGECGCVRNIVQAIQLGASRIGHGIALKDDPAAQQEIGQLPVCLECCPTSNLQTKAIASYEEFPYRAYLTHGVKFCLNTDNRTVSNTTLTKEYAHLLEHHAMTTAEFRQLNQNAIDFAFTTPEVKAQLSQKMAQFSL